MRDLHDGLSGCLVSIIALSERGDTDPKAIKNSACEALEDLQVGGITPANVLSSLHARGRALLTLNLPTDLTEA